MAEPAAFICAGETCSLPVTAPEQIAATMAVDARAVAWLAGEKVMSALFQDPCLPRKLSLLLVGVVLIFQGTFGIGVGIRPSPVSIFIWSASLMCSPVRKSGLQPNWSKSVCGMNSRRRAINLQENHNPSLFSCGAYGLGQLESRRHRHMVGRPRAAAIALGDGDVGNPVGRASATSRYDRGGGRGRRLPNRRRGSSTRCRAWPAPARARA